MKPSLFVWFLLLLSALGRSQPSADKAIRSLLQQQTAAWNQADLAGFMQTYWKSDSLIFIGKTGVTYGWQPTLDQYRKSYPDPAAMGQLAFEILKIEALRPDLYQVIGKWRLRRSKGHLQGHYTLLIKKFGNRWRIIQDHSS